MIIYYNETFRVRLKVKRILQGEESLRIEKRAKIKKYEILSHLNGLRI